MVLLFRRLISETETAFNRKKYGCLPASSVPLVQPESLSNNNGEDADVPSAAANTWRLTFSTNNRFLQIKCVGDLNYSTNLPAFTNFYFLSFLTRKRSCLGKLVFFLNTFLCFLKHTQYIFRMYLLIYNASLCNTFIHSFIPALFFSGSQRPFLTIIN